MLSSILKIQPGLTTIIGSGGKTTLLRRLGWELCNSGHRVLLCTTTKIFPFADIPCITEPEADLLDKALHQFGLVCAGTLLPESGKLTAPELPFEALISLSDYVLVEGDGSARLPLKAHLPQEPVVPPLSNQTICVAGLSGIGQPLWSAAHRAERFAELSGLRLQANVTAEAVARVLKQENLADRYLLNQADLPGKQEAGEALQRLLEKPAVLGSLYSSSFSDL